jgi:diacylglycerol kinase family enzyme
MQRPTATGRPDGVGVTIVINPSAGSGHGSDAIDELRGALPDARFVVVDEPTDLLESLEEAARAEVIGIMGGDGSINAAAGVALRNSRPLAVFPGGTLNHFARDLGVASVNDTIDALGSGRVTAIDVGMIDGRPFLNTASFGSYAELVDERERHEGRLGKWPAMALALVKVLRRAEPLDVTINGERRSVWLIFIGNGEYHPPGLIPRSRPRLDDGLFDVRSVDRVGRISRLRLIAATLTGQLARTPSYRRELTGRLTITSHAGPLRLARDGETFDGSDEFVVAKHDRPLVTYVPEDAATSR